VRKLGILGGVGWRSTADYYAEFCRRCEERAGSPAAPELSIESLSEDEAVSRLGVDGDELSWERFDAYHREGLTRLEGSGAEFAIIASNTPHHRFASIVRGVGIPVINLFEVAAGECARLGAREVLILGTALTMRSEVFRRTFAERGIEATGPEDAAAREAVAAVIGHLQQGRDQGAAARIRGIARRERFRGRGPRLVCLACTELPLAFPNRGPAAKFESGGMTYLNPTAAHVAAAFDYAVAGGGGVSGT